MARSKSETHLNAQEARAMSVEQMLRLQQMGEQLHPSDAAIAERLVKKCLARIRRVASEGKTEARFSVTEWTVWARDRDEVFRQLTREVDSLGFNTLVECEKRILGRRFVLKVEW